MKPIISVLIPAYNAEKTIEKTLKSLLNQSVQNFEVVIVNDGSTDGTQHILELYKKKSDIFRVYKQNNMGVAATRQILIENANGKYLLFCDADDYYDVNTIETVSKVMENENVDLLIFGYSLVRENDVKYINRRNITEGRYLKENCGRHHVNGLSDLYWSVLWNKCYKKNIIEEKPIIQFQDIIEDVIFNVEYMRRCKSVYILEKRLYNYVQIGESLTRGKKIDSEKKIMDAFTSFIYLRNELNKTYPNLSVNEDKYMYKMLIELCERANKIDNRKLRKKIIESPVFGEVKSNLGLRCYLLSMERTLKKVRTAMKVIMR